MPDGNPGGTDATSQRLRLRGALQRLDEHVPQFGTPQRAELMTAVVTATDELLRVEAERLAAEREEQRQAGARRIRRIAAPTFAALTVFAVLAVLPGWLSPWWLLVAVPQALGALWAWLAEDHYSLDDQQHRKVGAVVLAAAGAMTVLVAVTPIPAWTALFIYFVTVLAAVCYFDHPPDRTSDEDDAETTSGRTV